MRKIFTLLAIMSLLVCFEVAYGQEYSRQGKDFKVEKKGQSRKANWKLTDYTFTFSDGERYPVYVNMNSGRCIVKKVSGKTGEPYPYYLPEKVAKEICTDLGIEYKEKKANVDKKSL